MQMILYALNKLDNDQLDAEVHNVGEHQTHSVFIACCREMTHCGPLVLLRVVQEHLTPVLPEGRLATSCHSVPPSFSRVSVDANLELPLPYPPLTIYTCRMRVNIIISPQYSAVQWSWQRWCNGRMRVEIFQSSCLAVKWMFHLRCIGSHGPWNGNLRLW